VHYAIGSLAWGAVSLGILAATAAPLAGEVTAKGRTRTVTRTYSNPTAITIPDQGQATPQFPAQITVSKLRKGRVLDVNLTLFGVEHGYPDDIDVLLVSPDGRTAIVMSDVGGPNDLYGYDITLDDEANLDMPSFAQLAGGTYKPTNVDAMNDSLDTFPGQTPAASAALSSFDGINPNGKWELYVVDDKGANAGVVSGGWELELTATYKKKRQRKH
jgi:subtilisin-like proprotein convertase family protein